MRRFPLLLGSLLITTNAWAFNGSSSPSVVELASGTSREHVRVTHTPPAPEAWARFTDLAGSGWQAFWDADKRTPLRVYGAGIAAPGSVDDKVAAERFARAALSQHLDLWAPGTNANDFVLVANVLTDGVRAVGFIQTQDGLVVDGGQISFRFKHDRLVVIGVEAFPHLDVPTSDRVIDEAAATEAAQAWTAADLGVRGEVRSVSAPLIHAIVEDTGALRVARVRRVIVRTTNPVGRWAIDIDAGTGRRFARRQTLMFFNGNVHYNAPVRRPGAERVDSPAFFVDTTINGQAIRADASGLLTWTATGADTLVAGAKGRHVAVTNETGPDAIFTSTIGDGGTTVWDARDDEEVDAQVTTFIAAHASRDFIKALAPSLRYLDEQLVAVVNIDNECNAFSDGSTINFYRSSNNCENTGRLPDVVHHEYGHAVHAHAVIQGVGSFDSSLSEGASDYLAATMVDDPAMGRGFFRTNAPLRHLDPEDGEARYPENQGESHVTGLIVGGAFWDLRKAMIEKHGEAAGIQLVDKWWYATLQRSSNILTAYVEVITSDDDDGNLQNGTPNVCEISAAFAAHGIALGYTPGPELGALEWHDNTIVLPVGEGTAICPGAEYVGATLTYGIRGGTSEPIAVEMVRTPIGFAYSIPRVPEGNVLMYRVEVELGDGNTRAWPRNPAAPMYEIFVGEVRPLYCTDFEEDPDVHGWNHEMVESESSRARDEWEWGFPMGISGDPAAAFSGGLVYGQDLGNNSNGRYQGRKREVLRVPLIDVSNEKGYVRIQYRRWLTVQDGIADQAEILAYNASVWSNAATTEGDLHHVDYEWRFHDVDITELTLQNGGQVDVQFSLTSDRFYSFGGWTIDDFCIVAWDGPTQTCGDSMRQGTEACDDGNQLSADGCENDCTITPAPVCGNGTVETGEVCDDGNTIDGDGCEVSCVVTPEPEPKPMLTTEDEGCSCRATSARNLSRGWFVLLIGLVALGRQRR